MNVLNRLNKVLLIFSLILLGLAIFRVVNYKAWNQFHYTASVSSPKEFPIHILGIWFYTGKDFTDASFYKSIDDVNAFNSDWGISPYLKAYKPDYLPEYLFLEYIDFRTQNYYQDTIYLPKAKMRRIFHSTPEENLKKTTGLTGDKTDLEFRVGIANGGHIIFWLTGTKYQKEFYHTKLSPKPYPKTVQATDLKIHNKDSLFEKSFRQLADSTRQKLKSRNNIDTQYKDSIPIYFDNLQKRDLKDSNE